MSYAPKELQIAVYNKLTGNTALMAAITGVYDFIPDRQSFPFVTIGEGDFQDRGSHDTDGWTAVITINTWSRARGRKGAYDIMALIDTAMHNGSLSITGSRALVLRRDTSTVLVDPDAVTYHGVQRFKLLLAEP